MKGTYTYSQGDWLVHSHYGIGQIEGVDVNSVSGEETRYYRIKAVDSTFWMRVDQMDSEMLRPLSTLEEIHQAIAILQEVPKKMSANHKIRRSRIVKAQAENSLQALAGIIRDLQARQREKGPLNRTEHSTLNTLKQQLTTEWAHVTGATTEEIKSKLNDLLDSK